MRRVHRPNRRRLEQPAIRGLGQEVEVVVEGSGFVLYVITLCQETRDNLGGASGNGDWVLVIGAVGEKASHLSATLSPDRPARPVEPEGLVGVE